MKQLGHAPVERGAIRDLFMEGNRVSKLAADGAHGVKLGGPQRWVRVAARLVGRDQRNRTLSLYFSRPLERSDYALTKVAALTSALLILTWGPQLILFIGSALAEDGTDYLKDNWQDLLPIAASGLLISLMLASIGLACSAYVPRRAFAAALIIGLFVVSSAVTSQLCPWRELVRCPRAVAGTHLTSAVWRPQRRQTRSSVRWV